MAFPRRLRLLFVLACVAFGIIWLRMVQLQTVEREACAAVARKKRQTSRTLRPPRGRILDAVGAPLAWDGPIRQVAIVGADWQARARRRCPTCGTIHFHDPDRRYRTRRCGCRTPASAFEDLPPPDLGPLAAALGTDIRTLERLADDRVATIEEKAGTLREQLEQAGRPAFLLRDQVEQFRVDMMHRPYVYPHGEGAGLLGEVSEEVVRLVELDELGTYRGFRIQTALRRRYDPEGPAGQMLGFVSGVHSREELEALQVAYGDNIGYATRIGRAGVERAMDKLLVGENGIQYLVRDEDGAFTVDTGEGEDPRPGMELRLTLTREACHQADAVLAHHGDPEGYHPRSQPSGGFVAMRADTGAVVAWGELPRLVIATDLPTLYDKTEQKAEFDETLYQWLPADGTKLRDGETLDAFQRRISKPAPRHLSRVSQVAVEPGSTLKVFVGLGLLDGARRMGPGTSLPLESRGRYFACDALYVKKPGCHAHRDVDFVGAIEVSCNKYFAWSLRDFPAYWRVYENSVPRFLETFGFGQPTFVDVADESTGIFLRDWVDIDPRAAIQSAARLLQEEHGVHLKLDLRATVPERVAGRGAKRLTDRLVDAVADAAHVLGADRALLRVEGGERRHPWRDLVFRLRLPPPPPSPSAEDVVTKALKRLLAPLGALGVKADVEVEPVPGALTFAFRLIYHDRIGREEGEPAPLLAEDARNLAIGQGPVTTTPLQMVRAVAAIANGGRLVTPHVVGHADGQALRHATQVLDIPRADLERVRAGMRAVVHGSGGTARRTGLRHLPGTVYGKTGTSQPGGWWTPKGIVSSGVWHHWFVGFYEAPGQPPIAFACVLHARREEAAGLTSAEAVADFLEWWVRHA